MKNLQSLTYEELRMYYAQKYGKKVDESWERFWMRVDKILIARGRSRRETAQLKGPVF